MKCVKCGNKIRWPRKKYCSDECVRWKGYSTKYKKYLKGRKRKRLKKL